jgi:hypothetical protein
VGRDLATWDGGGFGDRAQRSRRPATEPGLGKGAGDRVRTETLFHLAVAFPVIVLKSMGSLGSLTNDRERNPFAFIIRYRFILMLKL